MKRRDFIKAMLGTIGVISLPKSVTAKPIANAPGKIRGINDRGKLIVIDDPFVAAPVIDERTAPVTLSESGLKFDPRRRLAEDDRVILMYSRVHEDDFCPTPKRYRGSWPFGQVEIDDPMCDPIGIKKPTKRRK